MQNAESSCFNLFHLFLLSLPFFTWAYSVVFIFYKFIFFSELKLNTEHFTLSIDKSLLWRFN